MTYVQVPNESFSHLQTLKSKYPQHKALLDEIDSNLNQRLWHQLSDNLILLSTFSDGQNSNSDLISGYNSLVVFVETAGNPMKLLIFIHKMLSNYKGRMKDAGTFIENIEKKGKLKDESHGYINIIKGFCYGDLNLMYDGEDNLAAIKENFESKSEIDSVVYSNYYKLATYYYDKKGNFDELYNNAFQYLAYEKQIGNEEKIKLCFNMCVASGIGERMFNFAELIEKDFFKLMLGTEYDWIYNGILSFNSAKVDQFISMGNTYAQQIGENPVLKEKREFLETKIRMAALLELVFQKNKGERTGAYKEIQSVCLVDEDNTELIVMKALSLGFIKGYIDQVNQKVIVNWVQPKYLDTEKGTVLQGRFGNWIEKANKMLVNFQDMAAPLLV